MAEDDRLLKIFSHGMTLEVQKVADQVLCYERCWAKTY
jgi:hypothetical protein